MDLEQILTTPKFSRKISIRTGDKVVLVEQMVEDFMPSRTTLRVADETRAIEHNLTIGQIRDQYLSTGRASCTVHLKDDLEIVFLDLDAPEKLKILDQRYRQQAEVVEAISPLAPLQIEHAVKAAEDVYLRNSDAFSDPYQYEDPRIEPVSFTTGSEAELHARITELFHAFPKIFEAVPEPRVFVYTEFNDHPAAFNVHLSHNCYSWQAESYLLSLVKQIVRENTPRGYCYRSGTGGLERRSDFHKDALFVTIAPTAPTPEQIQKARQNTSALFEKYQLTLSPELFEQTPLKNSQRKAAGNGNCGVSVLSD
jgi:hypothetical protein